MKKTICLILLTTLLLSLTACSFFSPSETTPGTTKPPAPSVYEVLSSLSEKSYLRVELTVTTKTEFAELSANYVLNQSSVAYRIEQLSTFPNDGSVPSEYKTTFTGNALVQNGEIVEFDGNDIVLPTYDELSGNFHFEESNFKNVASQNGRLTADVISPSAFYGKTVDMSQMHVEVEYSSTSFHKITLTYRTVSASVTTVYTFEN